MYKEKRAFMYQVRGAGCVSWGLPGGEHGVGIKYKHEGRFPGYGDISWTVDYAYVS